MHTPRASNRATNRPINQPSHRASGLLFEAVFHSADEKTGRPRKYHDAHMCHERGIAVYERKKDEETQRVAEEEEEDEEEAAEGREAGGRWRSRTARQKIGGDRLSGRRAMISRATRASLPRICGCGRPQPSSPSPPTCVHRRARVRVASRRRRRCSVRAAHVCLSFCLSVCLSVYCGVGCQEPSRCSRLQPRVCLPSSPSASLSVHHTVSLLFSNLSEKILRDYFVLCNFVKSGSLDP